MLSLLMKNGTSSSDIDSVDPSKNVGKSQSNQSQHLYPNLSQQPPPKYHQPYDEQKQTQHEGDNLMNNNITSDSDELIELEPEGIPMIAKPSPSYIPPINPKSIDQICKSLHSSIGLFKGKAKRTKAFQKMILTTTKSDRIAIRRQYFQKYKTTLNRVITRSVIRNICPSFFILCDYKQYKTTKTNLISISPEISMVLSVSYCYIR